MSYKTYTTEAIVCGSRANNTSDKSFLLFTREAGMLWASAKSVREERSRQRFALQEFSLIRVSLVRGKSGWRIGSAESRKNAFAAALTKEERLAVTSIVRLLRQFLHGDVAEPQIFDDAKDALGAAALKAAAPEALQQLFAFRLLYRLGYIPPHAGYAAILSAADWWRLPPLDERAAKTLQAAESASHL